MQIVIRPLQLEDCHLFADAFTAQGWNKPQSQFEQYLADQEAGERKVYVAQADGEIAGYATLLPQDHSGPFAGTGIPAICDFNVLEKFQRHGIGHAIMDRIESDVRSYSDRICLGVGLHRGYGAAQRMYVKRGYVPDGSGVWFRDENLTPYHDCCNDDDLVLYLSKAL